MDEHGRPARPRWLRQVARFEQAPVEGGEELLGPADIERPSHGHDRPDAGADQRRGHGSEGAFGVLIDGSRLARVQDHHGDTEFVQRLTQSLGGDRVGPAVRSLEHQASLRAFLEGVRIDGVRERGRVLSLIGNDAVAAVAVEVQDVIVAGPAAELLAEGIERGRTQDRHAGGEPVRLDLLDQGAGDGTVLHIALEGPGGDQQDIEPVAREIVGQGQRVGHVIELPLDVALVGQVAPLGVMEGLPRPSQDRGLVGDDAQLQVLRAIPHRVVIPVPGLARVEQGLEGVRAPGFQGRDRGGDCHKGKPLRTAVGVRPGYGCARNRLAMVPACGFPPQSPWPRAVGPRGRAAPPADRHARRDWRGIH